MAIHFLAMETCANSVNPDIVSPVVWQDIGERIVRLTGNLHNEHSNDLQRSKTRPTHRQLSMIQILYFPPKSVMWLNMTKKC